MKKGVDLMHESRFKDRIRNGLRMISFHITVQ